MAGLRFLWSGRVFPLTGLQSEDASVWHYVCNDEEAERFTVSSEVREL